MKILMKDLEYLVVLCRLAGHLVKTKILSEPHCSLFKTDSACGEKKYPFSYLKSNVRIGLIE